MISFPWGIESRSHSPIEYSLDALPSYAQQFFLDYPLWLEDFQDDDLLADLLEKADLDEIDAYQALSAYYNEPHSYAVFINAMTSAHFAALGGHESCLTQKDVKDKKGAGIGHYLSMGGRNIELLTKVDETSLFMLDDEGLSPLDYAFLYEKEEVVEWFAQKGSRLAYLMDRVLKSSYAGDHRLHTSFGIRVLRFLDFLSGYPELEKLEYPVKELFSFFDYIHNTFYHLFSCKRKAIEDWVPETKRSDADQEIVSLFTQKAKEVVQTKLDLIVSRDFQIEKGLFKEKGSFILDLIFAAQDCISLGYTLVGELGKGSFGTVYTVLDAQNNLYALKSFSAFMCTADKEENRWYNYFRAIDPKQEHHLVQKIAFVFFQNKPALVLEKYECNLYRFRCHYKEDLSYFYWITDIAGQILEALAFLHSKEIMYIDLKPDNVLFRPPFYFAITDFGSTYKKGTIPEKTHDIQTDWYRSPECLLQARKYYSYAMDIWSFGCILFELLARKEFCPFETTKELMAKQQKYLGMYPDKLVEGASEEKRREYRTIPLPTEAPTLKTLLEQEEYKQGPFRQEKHFSSFMDLLIETLELDPEKRISAAEARAHPFFASAS